jgi:hypothetical protein
MMLKIDILKKHHDSVPRLAEIWHEVLSRIWAPEISIARVTQRLPRAFEQLYLFTFDFNLPEYYNRFDFETISLDGFQGRAVIVMECQL